MRKRKVAVLGATGTVGRRFIGLLQGKNFGKMLVRVGEDRTRR